MKTVILNYRVVVEPDQEIGTGKPCYTAYCPTLRIADFGKTVDKALANMKKMIKFHLDCLIEEKDKIPPPDKEDGLVTNFKIEVPQSHFTI